MAKKNFFLDDNYNKILSLILYFIVLILIGIIYLSLHFLTPSYGQFITLTISLYLGINLIIYREKIIKKINNTLINIRLKRIRSKNKRSLNKTIKNIHKKNSIKKSLKKYARKIKKEVKKFYED